MRGRRGYPLLIVGIAALAAAGCGGGGSSSVVTVEGASGTSGANGPAALSKADFITQADAICGEANAALDGLSGAASATSTKLEASQQLQIVRSEYESIRSLPPSSQDRSTLSQFLSSVKSEVEALTRNKAAIQQGGDNSSAQSQFANAKTSAETAARSYGFQDCAKGAAPSSSSTATTAAPTTTTPAVPVPTTPPPVAPAPPAGGTGGTGGAPTGGGTSGGSRGGSGGSGGVAP